MYDLFKETFYNIYMSNMKGYKWKKPLQQAEKKLEERKEDEELKPSVFKMFNVESTNIKRLGYDASWRRMRVEFLNGSVYQYYNVDFTTWEKVKNGMAIAMEDGHTPSVGAALDRYVKKEGIKYKQEH
jgi:hypothetical protein